MRPIKLLLTGLLLCQLFSCNKKIVAAERVLHVSDFHFSGITGHPINDDTHHYSVIGSGLFHPGGTDNSDSLILAWILKHPEGLIIPVSTMTDLMAPADNMPLTYCLIADQQDTLNNYLIRNGCFPGSNMVRPRFWSEMSSEKGNNKKGGRINTVAIHLDRKSYKKFIRQITAAENFAIENKLGIWADEK